MFKKILIANRGEVAMRILRTCRDLGIEVVVVHSQADEGSMAVRLANESVCIGSHQSSDSYLKVANILSAARLTGAEAIHPGWGFLSENARFSEAVSQLGISFIGPSAEHISLMGDKIRAKVEATALGLPVVPGVDGQDLSDDEIIARSEQLGFPVIVKASAGGGGRGMRVATDCASLREALQMCRLDAGAAFGDSSVYVEKYLSHPRHIEVQLLADGRGKALHLGTRDCSIQRRHQKAVEEAPSPALSEEESNRLGALSAKAVAAMSYSGAGTIEYLYEDGEFYFIEMNTRLQVEHTISEMICGIDIVEWQLRIASGEALTLEQSDISFSGHSIECRINAEDPWTFMPSPGLVTDYHVPGGSGVRVDSHIFRGYEVPPYYDSLLSKLIVHAPNREQAIARMRRALQEYVIGGVMTNLDLHREIMEHGAFSSGDYDTHWLEDWMASRSQADSAI